MSKKKRLGRGLEALLGVGSKTDDDAKTTGSSEGKGAADAASALPQEPATNAPPAPDKPGAGGIELKNQGMEVNSIADITDPPQATRSAEQGADDELPTILKFEKKPAKASPGLQANASTATSSQPQPSPGPQSASTMQPASSEPRGVASDKGVVELNVYDVDDNPFQPRREFNKSEIESLAESLKTHEQLQPILVRRVGNRYQLISGERRLRAAVHAGWSKIRAQVREADDRLVAELAIVENLQRKDLNPVEKALSFRRYLDEHGCSQEDLAGRLKIDRSTVANLLRLLELPDVVQKAIQVGIISNGHARALLPLGEEHLQIEFCNRIQREGLSVRAIEQLVRDKIDEEDGVKRKSSGSKGRTKSGQILSLESELRNALGTKVEIKPSSRGRGKIVVHYLSRDEFDRLRELFGDSGGDAKRDAA